MHGGVSSGARMPSRSSENRIEPLFSWMVVPLRGMMLCCVAMRCGEKVSFLTPEPFCWRLQIPLGSPLAPAKEEVFPPVFPASGSLEAQKPPPPEPASLAGC